MRPLKPLFPKRVDKKFVAVDVAGDCTLAYADTLEEIAEILKKEDFGCMDVIVYQAVGTVKVSLEIVDIKNGLKGR